ncbi:unnamed protein product [Effrenium voratum]|uniref:starch synthase n=1 Tax=Effrenium voratum TaxID=2562239 RepID=A0AA36I228_9DINO|nr:unnamed protein product [Effrenium voratum]
MFDYEHLDMAEEEPAPKAPSLPEEESAPKAPSLPEEEPAPKAPSLPEEEPAPKAPSLPEEEPAPKAPSLPEEKPRLRGSGDFRTLPRAAWERLHGRFQQASSQIDEQASGLEAKIVKTEKEFRSKVSLTEPDEASLRSLVEDMSLRVASFVTRVDHEEEQRRTVSERRRKATDAVSNASLSFAEFLGRPEPVGGDSSRGLRVARSRTDCGEAIQMVDCDEYLVVVTGEFRLQKGEEELIVREGEGIFLEAGEKVLWKWDHLVQFITIHLPERKGRQGMVDCGVQAPEEKSLWATKLEPGRAKSREELKRGEMGYLKMPAEQESRRSGESVDTTDIKEASESAPSETDVSARAEIANSTSPSGDMNRIKSLSAFEQLVDNTERLRLREEMEERAVDRPARYGARHLNTPVVIVSSEINPWSKTGGLAMVASSYAYEFAIRGHRTMAVSPRYANYEGCKRVGSTKAWLAGQEHELVYYHQRQDFGNGRGCDYVFVDHSCFHRPQGLYGEPTGGEYPDNCFRFSLLCIAAAEAPLVLNLGGSIYGQEVCFIANDWQTGMLPVYLLYKYKRNRTFLKARCMMVLHNLGYQGKYRMSHYPMDRFFGLPDVAAKDLQGEDMHFGEDCINLLGGGVRVADRVLTVSPNYAFEIQTPEGGHGLHTSLREKASRKRVMGILNGISDEWNPLTDPHIVMRFGKDNFEEGKRCCKAELQRQLGLLEDPSLCLIGFCGRLCYQKGIHLIMESLPWLMRDEGNGVNGYVQIALMGKGDMKYESQLRAAEESYRGRVCAFVGFDPIIEHRMMAACDILLMPSQYEPCGLPQMYAQQYATLPVVHETGGLKDSVRGLWSSEHDKKHATGFMFDGFDPNKLKERLYQAMDIFRHKKPLWRQMQMNAIKCDYYWPQAIDEYERNIDQVMEDDPCCW